jgi:hypothetical protein
MLLLLLLAVPYHPANFLAGMAAPPVSWSVDIGAERAKVQQPWRLVEEAIHKHSKLLV